MGRKNTNFMRGLRSATLLSAGWMILPVAGANAQAGCSVSDGECIFPVVNEPLVYTFSGASGSQSDPGKSGPNYSFIIPNELDFSVPYNSAYQGLYIKQIGGDGSFSGPSAGGAGGNMAVTLPYQITTRLGENLNISDAAAGVLLWTEGGPGTDNNENNGSSGAIGGAGGSISSSGVLPGRVSLLAGSGSSNTQDLVAIELRSYGGNGGRVNSQVVENVYEGGNGGRGGDISWENGSVVVGTTDAPLTADYVVGIRARSKGGNGPDDYNSFEDEYQGGGGSSLGGVGGTIDLSTDGGISVVGRTNNQGGTFGFFAQSNGGNGGWAFDVGDLDFKENGGKGGDGGAVNITTTPESVVDVVDTGTSPSPFGSKAILAVSNGGIGGQGQSGTIGGSGGDGGKIDVDISEDVTVTGIGADAIYAKSQGGQGGAGLENANDSTGGSGGNGGQVIVKVHYIGDIAAKSSGGGSNSGRGIVAQSLSGLGGLAGDGNLFLGTPGTGGLGGDGGDVNVHLDTTITTDGTNDPSSGLNSAVGILAHSVGGGGGDGGEFSNFLRGSGGAGGVGGSGGTVEVNNDDGKIQTNGLRAAGIVAQSIGGGGGFGGAANGVVLALGGSGGSGGSSGTVTVTNSGDITTTGYNAFGIHAQSIAGGGGSAGVSNGGISIGGTGGNDSCADQTGQDDGCVIPGDVQISNTDSITTQGDAAAAILAQSIGGGGGNAAGTGGRDTQSSIGVLSIGASGGGAGPGGNIYVTEIGDLTTNGVFAPGFHAQSIGGGGGNGGDAFSAGVLLGSAAVGGNGGGGGDAGLIEFSNTRSKDVRTRGEASPGILLQTIGGSGGSGGDAQTDDILTLFQYGIGGNAKGGGDGGTITAVLTDMSITTENNRAPGIIAHGIGGSGGSGGSGTSRGSGFLNIGAAMGGLGGSGGDGGDVGVTLVGGTTIETSTGIGTDVANDSIGVIAQSIGGGGGTAGASLAKAITLGVPFDPEDPDMSVTINAQFAAGGRGGNGGDGDLANVTVAEGSSITTNGAGSHGILVQAIGGGGGSGGDASTATTTIPDTTEQASLTLNGALGGAGGAGGDGGIATAILGSATPSSERSVVTTTGDYSNGIVVQSIGGGGGNSGLPTSKTNEIRGKINAQLTFDMGAGHQKKSDGSTAKSNEAGGDAEQSSVTLYADSSIATMGHGARGALVQSIGGGGGTVQGGEIQLGGDIKAPGGGVEEVAEDDPEGEGEGGGASFTGTATVNLGMAGGEGGDGGFAGALTKSGSTIVTKGIDADGILVQSVGGGGGLAGTLGSNPDLAGKSVGTADVAEDPGEGEGEGDGEDDELEINVAGTVSVGGRGGGGGDGGAASVDFASQVTTSDAWADGLVVQSIGGGGGTGGTALSSGTGETMQVNIGVGGRGGTAGDGGAVKATFDDASPGNFVHTSGFMAHGVLLQSIGGGGGQGGDGSDTASGDLTIGSGVGGSGGTSGNGGTVTIPSGFSWLNAVTNGNDAHGLIAQSIGGGGGIGGVGSADSEGDDDSHAIDLLVGGQGGSGGAGNAVSLTLGTSIKTYGNRSFGLLAQSIGGGGGLGTTGTADGVASIGVGGFGGNGGDGGSVVVDLTTNSNITTAGDGAHAIIAQSIGGGGGIGGDISVGSFSYKPAFIDGAAGTGGTVSVTGDIRIVTTGDNAHGIIAQSIGGGGGIGGDSNGVYAGSTSGLQGASFAADDVTVKTTAPITVSGANSIGILAQSMGGGNGGDLLGKIDVTAASDVTGGSGDGVGVLVASGTGNTVTIADGASVSAGSGTAIRYTSNGTTLEDSTTDVLVSEGSLIGDVVLENADGRIAGTVSNGRLGVLSGADLYAADVVNNGLMTLGRTGRFARTAVTGDFSQSAAGTLAVATDFERSRVDRLDIAGDAELDGALGIAASTIAPGDGLTVLSAGGDLTGSFEAVDTPAVDFEASTRDDRVELSIAGTRFGDAFDDLDRNQQRVGDHLDDIFSDGARNGFATLLAEINDLSASGDGGRRYGQALSSLTLGGAQAIAATQVSLASSRLDGTLTCNGAQGGYVVEDPDRCFWASLGGASVDQDGTGGYDGEHFGVGGGTRVRFGDDWVFGLAAGLERSDFDASNGLASTDGTTAYLGLSIGRDIGGFSLSAAVTGSFSDFDTTRRLLVPSFDADADGQTEIYTLGGRLRGAYTFDLASAYIRPMVDLDVVHIHASGYEETGAGILDLRVESENETAFVATPAVEIGTERMLGDGWSLGAFGNGGLSFSTLDDWTSEASFAGAGDVGTFRSSVPVPDVLGKVGAGVSFANQSGFEARLEYRGAFGEDYESHGGLVRLTQGF